MDNSTHTNMSTSGHQLMEINRQLNKWWQSTPGQERVTIRLNLENIMELSNISILFKEHVPSAMLLETSSDFGRNWKLFNYYSNNCEEEYPGVPKAISDVRGKISCINYPNNETNVQEKLLVKVNFSSIRLVTNFRLNLTKFPLNVNWYSIDEMYVKGSCNCHGHASLCIANSFDDSSVPGMVYSSCLCQHNTRGSLCEMCHDLYNDRPWEAGNANNKNECQSKYGDI